MKSDGMSFERHLAEAWGVGAWGTNPEAALTETAARFPIPIGKILSQKMLGRLRLGPDQRAELIRWGHGLPFPEKYRLYMFNLWNLYTGPLWPDELELSHRIVEAMHVLKTEWYHGGQPGRQVGDKLLPPKVTGVTPRGRAIDPERQHYVWMSPRSGLAGIYASPDHTPDGQLYRIRPEGMVTVEPRCLRLFLLWMDDPELEVDLPRLALMIPEYRCESATVLEVMV